MNDCKSSSKAKLRGNGVALEMPRKEEVSPKQERPLTWRSPILDS